MTDFIKKIGLAGDVLRSDSAANAEADSLALSLAALRRRKRQQQILRWGLPAVGIAASLLATAILFRTGDPPEIAHDNTPPDELVVDTGPRPEGLVFRSRPSAQVSFASRSLPGDFITRTAPSGARTVAVSSSASSRLELLTDRELIAALGDRPIMLAKTSGGERRLVLLDEDDRQLLWEPEELEDVF